MSSFEQRDDLIRVGIRYCGGCNPTFERVAALESLILALEGKVRAVDHREDSIQALLFVCGCPTACPAQESLPPELPFFVLRAQDDLQEALRWLRALLQERQNSRNSDQ